MNKKLMLLLSLFLATNTNTHQQVLQDLALRPNEKLFAGLIENRQKQLEKIQEEKVDFTKKRAQADQEVKALLESTSSQINRITQLLATQKDNEFYQQKLRLLNDLDQTLKDILRSGEKVSSVIDDYSEYLHKFLEDPQFTEFKNEHKLNERLFYSFEDLQRLYNVILDQEKKVSLLTDQENHLATELDNRKRASNATEQAYKTKREQIEAGKLNEDGRFDAQQHKEIIDLEEQLYRYHKALNILLIKEMNYRMGFVSLQLSIAKSHLTLYKDYLKTIKPAVRITEADIVHAREQLTQQTTQYRKVKERYRSEIDNILLFKNKTEHDLQELTHHFGISLSKDINEWSKQEPQSVMGYLGYCEVGAMHEQFQVYQRKQNLLETQIELEDEKLKEDALLLQVKESFHKKYNTEEEIAQELKKYEAPRAEATAGLSRYKEKINVVADQLNTQKKTLDNINLLRQSIIKQRETIFRGQGSEFNRCLALLKRAEAFEREQIDTLSKLTGVYSGLTSVINNKLRLVNFITGELDSRTIWHRPDYAITWDGVKNIIPDIVNFLTYVRTYFTHVSTHTFIGRLQGALKEPMIIVLFLIKLALIALALLVMKRALPSVCRWLMNRGKITTGFAQKILLLSSGIFDFIRYYFLSISTWLFIFAAISLLNISDNYLYILFYLGSIAYLLYLGNRFINYLAQFNKEHDYLFLAEDFQRRFFLVFGFLLFATIIIQFFREAFMLAHYYRSELPTILLALNFIIFQITLILLIDKEQILGLIPTRTELWQSFRDLVDRYYYLILLIAITIIVMSNPYVGFGRLVLYVLFGMMYSVILFMLLYWLHGTIKRASSRLFFINIDDVARERFDNAKTWFGITIICSFIVLFFFGLVVGAKIWQWPVTLSKIKEFLNYPIIGADTEQAISAISFSKIFGVIFIGILISYGMNKFVLDRIFDLLLVDPGVQHTVTSITQYVIVIIALFLGFHIANLGVLVNYIVGGLVLGLGWVLKEPIGDFVSYFIILVQRPVKIGDYIKINNDIQGVVRKITARAVILRRKNSNTLIVPNSYLISQTITNWNYTRNFIAFDDIILHIDYSEDPEKVREILYNVVEAHPHILKNPKPWVRLDGFGEYGFEFMVRGFISSVYTLEKWEIASNIRIAIVKAFDEHQIKIALPTRLLLTRTRNRLGDSVMNSGSGQVPGSKELGQ